MPTAFPLKEWEDEPSEGTPIDRESLRDAEQRLAEWSESPASLPEVVQREEEDELGKVSGRVKLDCTKGNLFVAELIGATEFEFINIPARKYEAAILVEPSGFAWSVPGLKWIGSEPEKPLTGRFILTVLIRKGGAELIGRQ